jgi:hypothetical protein
MMMGFKVSKEEYEKKQKLEDKILKWSTIGLSLLGATVIYFDFVRTIKYPEPILIETIYSRNEKINYYLTSKPEIISERVATPTRYSNKILGIDTLADTSTEYKKIINYYYQHHRK